MQKKNEQSGKKKKEKRVASLIRTLQQYFLSTTHKVYTDCIVRPAALHLEVLDGGDISGHEIRVPDEQVQYRQKHEHQNHPGIEIERERGGGG